MLFDLRYGKNRDGITVFYHIFTSNKGDFPRVMGLVHEQLSQLKPEIHNRIFVNTFGHPFTLRVLKSMATPEKTKNIIIRRQGKRAAEFVTLSDVWNYCQRRPNEKVIYLHSKGSFRPTPTNKLFRQALTYSALSHECAHLPDACDLCSLRMSPFPYTHPTGNMWLAKCSYIKKLAHPNRFLRLIGTKDSSFHGTGRFAAEHWPLSHPEAKACDLYTNHSYLFGEEEVPTVDQLKDNMQLQMAPRTTLLENLEPVQDHDYFPLYPPYQWRMHMYDTVYNRYPPSDWWGWDFFNAKHDVNHTFSKFTAPY